ncbi:RdgB/HAM1 family non-canonical purine NTP pyrophosphatase [Paenibacillus sp. J5C_2022]|uniref:RdgB/HAM1 family non-canonical purine NTP pyrophosphatase n=1 Tax=Paenibacillus sp. J5C2022 TaxID=2977129 RepID=UPI0021D25583|nr:RdgB/HAM1 family non-canonical purine NTP pyrophosphatase [Paenibacillus sp. J5C2022]MCU6712464.1 RdgB/HAM1 family non-canonical purine NTP pyrophosphatase [Paenibacillus sp. J5C2022]
MTDQLIIIASKNKGKIAEFSHAFGQLGMRVASLHDYPDFPDIAETGDTFRANARLKAKTLGDALGIPVLADDSGLEVDALGGEPGVYSARYAGEGATDAANNAKLLKELAALHEAESVEAEKLPDGSNIWSKARFVCVLSLYDPADGSFLEAEGEVAGVITDRPHGDGGFGYDPLFWLPWLGRGMAELSKDEKGGISHRGEALRKLLARLSRSEPDSASATY